MPGNHDERLPDSLNPFFAEAVTNLQAILEGAVAYYERQPPGACAFPGHAESTIEWTCCGPLGGPDPDDDGLCDELNPSERTAGVWDDTDVDLTLPVAFVYVMTTVTDEDSLRFEARACSDLDCDVIRSTFIRFARPVEDAAGREAVIVPGLFVAGEVE